MHTEATASLSLHYWGFGIIIGTKIIADPGICFQVLIAVISMVFLRGRSCLELIFISSGLLFFLFLQEKVLESVGIMNSNKEALSLIGPALSGMNFNMLRPSHPQ